MATGYLLHLGATVNCLHGGTAQPMTTDPRVKVGGQPISVQTSQYVIAGCSLAASSTVFCANGTWVKAALRVKAGAVPVVLQDSQAVCTASGTGLQVISTQTRVKGE